MLEPGEFAPNIDASTINPPPANFNLSTNNDKVVVLAFVSEAANLVQNQALMTRLQNIWPTYSGGGEVQMAAVYCGLEAPGSEPAWVSGAPFPVVRDTGTYRDLYAEETFPMYPLLFIITREYPAIGGHQTVHFSAAYGSGVESEAVINGRILDAIYHRPSIDLELVMDVSDSMNDPAPGGGSDKLVLMQQATDILVNFFHEYGQVDDRVGLVSFTDDADIHDGTFYTPLSGTGPISGELATLSTGLCTAMGAGLKEALQLLEPSPRQRCIIMLTDGMQNIEPYLRRVFIVGTGFRHRIMDDGGSGCTGTHSSTDPDDPTNYVEDYNTKIFSIGVGITATYEPTLDDVSDATGGLYLGTNNPTEELILTYMLDMCKNLEAGSPTVIHHHAGIYHRKECRAVETFLVDQSVRKLTAILSWEKELDGDLSFWLRAPDGTLLDLHKEMRLFDTYAMATVYLPNEKDGVELPYVGQWEMIIGGVTDKGSVPYQAMVIGEDPVHRFRFDYPRKVYEVGDIVPLAISLTAEKYALTDPIEIVLEHSTLPVPVTELVAEYRPNPELIKELTSVNCEKCKQNPLELKLESLARDPRMQDRLTPIYKSYSLSAGTLDCKIEEREVILPVTLAQPGLNNYRVTAQFRDKTGSIVSRTSMVSVHVDPGKADPKKSVVKPFSASIKGAKEIIVHVTPRNAANQLLGPGLSAEEFELKIGRSSHELQVEDMLDGSYRIKVPLGKKAPAKSQQASLTLKGQPLWKGTIEKLV